jgi:hypothetical protein
VTAFSGENFSFTQRAHLAAQKQFYPGLWPGADVTFIDTTKAEADLVYAVDCIAEVSLPDAEARGPVKFYIQERWRRPDFKTYRDLTITEWNLRTNQPSELHKLGAQLFVYGIYDQPMDEIVSALAIDIVRMQIANVRGELKYTRQKRRGGEQSFIGIEWDHLADIDAVLHSLNAIEASKTAETMTDKSRWTPEERKYWGVE